MAARHSNIARSPEHLAEIRSRAESERGYVADSFRAVEAGGLIHCSWRWELPALPADPVDISAACGQCSAMGPEWRCDSCDVVSVCAACGQSVLTTPDDPPQTLLCDVCLTSLERRRALRPSTIAANPPQGGLF